jgi:U3 small nucleolar RNA-associated protein 21
VAEEDDVIDISLPSMQGTAEEENDGKCLRPWYVRLCAQSFVFAALEALEALTMQDKPRDVFSTPAQLDGDLITLTLLPRSRWQTLLNLEVIQVRLTYECSAPWCLAYSRSYFLQR